MGSFPFKGRMGTEQVIEEHRMHCEKEEVEYITYSSGSSSSASSIYGSDDSSSSIDAIREIYERQATQPFPNALSLPERIKPENFGVITQQQVFRSSYPLAENFNFLEALELRTIITLVDEPIPDEYRKWMKERKINHITALVIPNKEHKNKRTDVKQISHVLGLMMDPKNQPLLIHCNKGKHRSGCVAAAFRKCSGQAIETIIDEYASYAGDKARDLDIAFIRAFDEREFLRSGRRDTAMEAMLPSGALTELDQVNEALNSAALVERTNSA